jgi:hypothetical protein
MNSTINGVLRLVTAGALLLVIYEQDKQINRMKTVENCEKDSLVTQTHIQQEEIDQYENALMLLDQVDTTATSKFLSIIENSK